MRVLVVDDDRDVAESLGIRTDAYMTDCLVEQNIAYRCNCGGLNMKYYDNHAINNVVVDIPPIQDVDIEGNPITLSFGHISVMGVFPRDEMPPGSSARVERNIIYKTDATQPFYREARRGGDRAELGVENCAADANLYYAPAEPDLGQGHLARYQALGLDTNSVIADPGFIDLVGGDFRLRADSPALALGIESIDTSGIGLIASLPHFEDLGG